jgi:hypothetical protein
VLVDFAARFGAGVPLLGLPPLGLRPLGLRPAGVRSTATYSPWTSARKRSPRTSKFGNWS